MSKRVFAFIEMENFKKKINEAQKEDGFYSLFDLVGNDIKVLFDLENVKDSVDFTPIAGFHTEKNGLTYYGVCVGGDWEFPVFVCIYWDGKKLRAYIPTEGNPWNTSTKTAYGNDEDKDALNMKKRWPLKFSDDCCDIDDLEYDCDLIVQDILDRFVAK